VAGHSRVLYYEIANLNPLASFGSRRFDAEQAAIELKAQHDAENPERVGDPKRNHRLVDELLQGRRRQSGLIVAQDLLRRGERRRVSERTGIKAG
jgi:hypothetical protein